jgi:tetratricopeptide (TPR) repeat protein
MNWKTILISYSVSLITFISYFLGIRKPKGNWFKVLKPVDFAVLILCVIVPTLIVWNDVETAVKQEEEINQTRYFGVLEPKEKIILPYERNYKTTLEIGWSLNVERGVRIIYNGGALSNIFKSDKNPYLKVFEDIKLKISEKDSRLLVSTIIRDSNGLIIAEIINNEWKVSPPPNTFDRNYTNNMLEVRNLKGDVVLQVGLLKDRVQLNGIFYDSIGNGVVIQPRFEHAILILLGEDPPNINIDPIFVYPSEFHLGELSSLNSNDAEYWNKKGDALFRANKIKESLRCFNKAVKLNPYNAQIWYNKIICLLKLDYQEETINTLDEALKNFPDNKEFWYLRGIYFRNKEDVNNSLVCFNRSLMYDSISINALNMKAEALNIIQKFEESMVISDRVYELDSLNEDMWFNTSVSLFGLRKYENSLEWIDKVLKNNPKEVSALVNKSASLGQLGRTKEALDILLQASYISNDFDVYIDLGGAYSELKKYKTAISYYDSCLYLKPTKIDVYSYKDAYSYKGTALENIGKFSEAIHNYDIAISLGKEDGEIYCNRGNSKYKLGKKDEACDDWEKSFKVYGYKQAYDNLMRYCKEIFQGKNKIRS